MRFQDPPKGQPSWLALSQTVFNLQANRWDTDHCNGGLRWQIFTWNLGYDYKNSISNGGFFQLAARLARYTGNDTYAQWADKTWDWMAGTALFTPEKGYAVYDGANIANNCTNPSRIQWTYNVGTMLMGAANMYNYVCHICVLFSSSHAHCYFQTKGAPKWRTRVQGLINASQLFFPQQYGGNVMQEVACEPQNTCNNDQPSFKAYLAQWLAATSKLAPFTADYVREKLHDSAMGAAAQCVGGSGGSTCGRAWHSTTWDGKTGVGEEMSALSVIQSNLVRKVKSPVTQQDGGTSIGDPSAGSQGDHPNKAFDPSSWRKITVADKAGAGVVTALVSIWLVATTSWMCIGP